MIDFETRQAQIESNDKTVFISYSYDSSEHISWVKQLARDIRAFGYEVVLDQDEYTKDEFNHLSTEERNYFISNIMVLAVLCRNIVFVNTPHFCEVNVTKHHYNPESKKMMDDKRPTHTGFLETQLIFYNLEKKNNRVISILRKGENWLSGTGDRQFPMIDFREGIDYSESLDYLIHYLEEPLQNKNFKEILPRGAGTVRCNNPQCNFSFPFSLPPPKVCKNCGFLYQGKRWLCPRCGYNKFSPSFIPSLNASFMCFHCYQGELEFIE